MKGYPGLFKRKGSDIYEVRRRVPDDLQQVMGKTELWLSLQTTRLDEALSRYRQTWTRWTGEIEAARRKLNARLVDDLDERTVQHIAVGFGVDLVREDERNRLLGFLTGNDAQDGATRQRWAAAGGDPDHWRAYRGRLAFMLHFIRQDHGIGRVFEAIAAFTTTTLAAQGIKLPPESLAMRKLSLAMQAAAIEALENGMARFEGGGRTAEAFAAAAPGGPVRVSGGEQGPLLADEIAAYLGEKTASLDPKTIRAIEAELASFLEVVGNKPITEITMLDFRAYRDALKWQPLHKKQQAAFKALSFAAAAAKAREISAPAITNKTFNKRLGFVGGFWAHISALSDNLLPSPVKNMLVKGDKNGPSAIDERPPFPLSDLPIIFRAPLYTGCLSIRNWRQAGKLVPRDSAKFWLPLMGLFMGLRLGEAAGAETAEVIDVANANGQRVGMVLYLYDREGKTEAAKRVVPVHPELMKIGFGAFVEMRRRQGETRLFPDIEAGSDGKWSHNPSKWFNGHFLPSIGFRVDGDMLTKEQALRNKTVFHSFRHNFEDACTRADMHSEIRDMFLGHASKAAERVRKEAKAAMSGRYGSRVPFALLSLLDEIAKVEYEGLDLSHLHIHAPKG